MPYIENPKTAGSGIASCIPQKGTCPIGCADCFFRSGRSYLDPLEANLPNMPDPDEVRKNGWVVRVNDGNDSNIDRELVVKSVQCYLQRFYNTSIPKDLGAFDAPVVLTLNPGTQTSCGFHIVEPIPKNLMFVRIRVSTWYLPLVDRAVDYYTEHGVPVVLTFMAYFDTAEDIIPTYERFRYVFRKRTLNSYWAITTEAWREVMKRYENNKLVYSCGKIEGEIGDTKCKFCGNCLREWHATMERMRSTT